MVNPLTHAGPDGFERDNGDLLGTRLTPVLDSPHGVKFHPQPDTHGFWNWVIMSCFGMSQVLLVGKIAKQGKK